MTKKVKGSIIITYDEGTKSNRMVDYTDQAKIMFSRFLNDESMESFVFNKKVVKMVKHKENCFKYGLLTDDLIPFYMIDDWCQFEIKLCHDCNSKANQEYFECAEEWLCPICKKVYCCTICGSKEHHPTDCEYYVSDEDFVRVFNEIFPSFRKKTVQWCAVTPHGVMLLGEVDQEETNRKIVRERTEMQSLLMVIRKKVRKQMPEIADLIKYYFNSKYGEMGEGIMSRATFSKKVLENAIHKHAIYRDTDCFILDMLEIKDVLKKIITYPVNKNRILVIGDRGIGKSSVIISLIEKWKQIDSIESELDYSSNIEIWRVLWNDRKYEFTPLPSLMFENEDIFKQTCLIINVEQRIDYNKEMRCIFYWLSERINNTEIIMSNRVDISYCSKEGYEQYKSLKLKKMKELMDK